MPKKDRPSSKENTAFKVKEAFNGTLLELLLNNKPVNLDGEFKTRGGFSVFLVDINGDGRLPMTRGVKRFTTDRPAVFRQKASGGWAAGVIWVKSRRGAPHLSFYESLTPVPNEKEERDVNNG